MNHRGLSRALGFLLGTSFLTVAGCGDIVGGYEGPQPTPQGISSEVAIVRIVRTPHQGQLSYILDRVRFPAAGDPHNVDRVVLGWVPAGQTAQVQALDLQAGDQVIISTEFTGVHEVGELTQVPNWPGHRFREYPIGNHRLTSIARTP